MMMPGERNAIEIVRFHLPLAASLKLARVRRILRG
jgi:hypothetical protein